MKNNSENIPDHIFDLLQRTPFTKLNTYEKEEVRLYFTEQEYAEMHSALGEVKAVKRASLTTAADRSKELLMQEFDKRYPAGKHKKVLSLKISLWKAAAVFLIFASLVWVLKSGPADVKEILITQTDTQYIEKLMVSEPLPVYDTFYVREENKAQGAKSARLLSKEIPVIIRSEDNILEMEQMRDAPNLPKNNSMKDDSLLQEFSFVTL